jgi:hypothetical protein
MDTSRAIIQGTTPLGRTRMRERHRGWETESSGAAEDRTGGRTNLYAWALPCEAKCLGLAGRVQPGTPPAAVRGEGGAYM